MSDEFKTYTDDAFDNTSINLLYVTVLSLTSLDEMNIPRILASKLGTLIGEFDVSVFFLTVLYRPRTSVVLITGLF